MKHKILILLLIINCTFLIAEIRYVSKAGSSTPPYTNWETASDSIQKCINICNNGDTVIVGNGVYKEHIYINTNICLIGSSMDSTIIDSRGIYRKGVDSASTVSVYAKFEMKNFTVKGNPEGVIIWMLGAQYGMTVTDMRLENGSTAVVFYNGNNIAENLIIRNTRRGFFSGDFINLAIYDIKNNSIVIDKQDGFGYYQNGLGILNLVNNIIVHTNPNVSTEPGILLSSPGKTIIKNNIVAGFKLQQYNDSNVNADTIFIINNVLGYTRESPTLTLGVLDMAKGDKRIVKNNIIMNAKMGIEIQDPPLLAPNYNLYWNIGQKYTGHVIGGKNEIEADPMVVNDALPSAEVTLDMHLQAFSPAIDKGDPSISDNDGTRSDIGMYGGPLGEVYSYLDLPPKEPRGLTVSADTAFVTLIWKKNTETDFSHYKLFRDTVPGFTVNANTFITSLSDTFYTHNSGEGSHKYYYKLTAIDSQENESGLSEEAGIITSIDGDNTWQAVTDYHLYQNYPNPFNPATIIPYRLKERGYVKLIVYDIKGELVKVLVNKEKEQGYYEAEFSAGELNLSSGIYLYRIEVKGNGNKPVYMDMKKMLLIK